MLLSKEEERFKVVFSSEILEYHFEKSLGKNSHNALPWRTLLEDNIQPHTDILCDFSKWLIKHGWSREVVEKLFFVVAEDEDRRGAGKKYRF